MRSRENGFKRTVKERRQSDHKKKTEKLESKFENLDANNSDPISPFKGRNIVDLRFLCQQLVQRVRTFSSLNVTILMLYLFYVTKKLSYSSS